MTARDATAQVGRIRALCHRLLVNGANWLNLNRTTRERVMGSLPRAVAELVLRVVRTSGLRRSEKAEVADELVDHFREGIGMGSSVEQLIADFGDPKHAAKLIRRSKLRCRSWPDRMFRHAMRGTGIMVVALIALYGVLYLRFVSAQPQEADDYFSRINAASLAIPEPDRAWPLYRQALIALGDLPLHTEPDWIESLKGNSALVLWGWEPRLPSPGDALWAQAEDYLDRHRDTLELIEEATRRPQLGFVYSAEFRPRPAGSETNPLDPLVFSWARYHPLEQQIAAVIALDGRRASHSGDAAGFLRDVRMMQALAGQLGSPSGTKGRWVYESSLDMIAQMLAEYPSLLSNEELGEIAHTLSAFQPAVDLSGAVSAFEESLRMLYTEDGDGNGRLTPTGYRALVVGRWSSQTDLDVGMRMFGPIYAAAVLSQRDMLREYREMMSKVESESRRPLWEMHDSEAQKDIVAKSQSTIGRWRLGPIWMTVETKRVGPLKELAVGHRDAVLTAIALELYRRRHSHWPDELSRLVPSFLPQVPLDRFDGRPLRYKLIGGKPLLYSVGPDTDDDGGRSRDGHPGGGEWMADWIGPTEERHLEWYSDGDWILWPVPK